VVKRVVALVVVAAALWGRPVCASTNCTQKFTLIARTKGANPTFWIGEDLGGECHQSYLLQVSMVNGKAVLVRSDLDLQKDWKWLVAAMKRFRTEQPIELVKTEGRWRAKGVKWFVAAPAGNGKLMTAFRRHIEAGGDGGTSWNRKMGKKGILLPVVKGIDVEMVHAYECGLYVDYELTKVYYFAKSGYLLGFTGQKQLAAGGDTMHGFVLMRRTK